VFTTKTGNETLHSPPSKEVRGVFDKSANATVFSWEWNEDIEEDEPPQIVHSYSLDSLKHSTLHLKILKGDNDELCLQSLPNIDRAHSSRAVKCNFGIS
jgi:hypothetical protein